MAPGQSRNTNLSGSQVPAASMPQCCRHVRWAERYLRAQDTPSSALYARCATAGGVRHLRALAIGRMDTIISYSGPGRRVSARPLLDSVPGSVYRCTRWRDGIRAACGFARPTPTNHSSSRPGMLEKHCYFPDLHRQRRIRHGWRISAGVRCWPTAEKSEPFHTPPVRHHEH